MTKEWQELTQLTRGAPIVIERVRLVESGIALEGEFELPSLARLPGEDQIFIMAFVRCHGSIKEMERVFGISYPTVKNRLGRIARQLKFVEVYTPSPDEDIITKLEEGAITANEAIERLSK
jgi:hypothetical protein